MKIRLIVYILILIIGIGLYLYFTPDKPKWSPWYCSQFSGSQSYAWGKGGEADKCLQAGCQVKKTKEFVDDPQNTDDTGFFFKCVR